MQVERRGFFEPEVGGNTSVRNIAGLLLNYIAIQLGRLYSLESYIIQQNGTYKYLFIFIVVHGLICEFSYSQLSQECTTYRYGSTYVYKETTSTSYINYTQPVHFTLLAEIVWRALFSQHAIWESELLCKQNLDKTYINSNRIKEKAFRWRETHVVCGNTHIISHTLRFHHIAVIKSNVLESNCWKQYSRCICYWHILRDQQEYIRIFHIKTCKALQTNYGCIKQKTIQNLYE